MYRTIDAKMPTVLAVGVLRTTIVGLKGRVSSCLLAYALRIIRR